MRTLYRALFLVSALAIGLLVALPGDLTAQPQDDSCPVMINQALEVLAGSCDVLDRNSACYGYDQLATTFVQEVEPGFFTEPADRSPLTILERIQTAALNLETGAWGIAVLNVQANVPGTLPGQAVTFLLIGDVELENRVSPDEAFVSDVVVPVQVRTGFAANVRSAPATTASILMVAGSNDIMQADAQSEDGGWLRVAYEDRPGWVNRGSLVDDDEIDTLPVVTSDTQTPMQAFYFRTGIGTPACEDAPDVITVQSPERFEVRLNVNGADIGLGSTVSFKSTGDNTAVIVVLEGTVTLPDGRVIEAGQTVELVLDDDGTVIEFGEIREATDEELQYSGVSASILDMLFGDEEDEPEPEPEPTPTETPLPPPPTATPQPDVFVPPAPPAPPVSPTVDCGPFRATSPLDGLAYGTNRFYWDAAPGATGYRVTVFNDAEGRVAFFLAPGDATSLTATLDHANIGGGFSFSWEVHALLDDEVVCGSQRVSVPRSAPAPPPTGFTASWFCDGSMPVVVFSGAEDGEEVTLTYSDFMEDDYLDTATGPSGQFFLQFPDVFDGVVTTASGAVVNLEPFELVCMGGF
jgi:hypothetical protein